HLTVIILIFCHIAVSLYLIFEIHHEGILSLLFCTSAFEILLWSNLDFLLFFLFHNCLLKSFVYKFVNIDLYKYIYVGLIFSDLFQKNTMVLDTCDVDTDQRYIANMDNEMKRGHNSKYSDIKVRMHALAIDQSILWLKLGYSSFYLDDKG
ncbi:hypothetical protein ACJX0J_019073, partial [Zea mays]